MDSDTFQEFLARLRSGYYRHRTGIVLLPTEQLGQEQELAARYNLEPVDYVRVVLEGIQPGSELAGLDPVSEQTRLDQLASDPGKRDCCLIWNFDLGLSRLDPRGRAEIWRYLRDQFPYRPRTLVLTMPAAAHDLLPVGYERQAWESSQRLIAFGDPS